MSLNNQYGYVLENHWLPRIPNQKSWSNLVGDTIYEGEIIISDDSQEFKMTTTYPEREPIVEKAVFDPYNEGRPLSLLETLYKANNEEYPDIIYGAMYILDNLNTKIDFICTNGKRKFCLEKEFMEKDRSGVISRRSHFLLLENELQDIRASNIIYDKLEPAFENSLFLSNYNDNGKKVLKIKNRGIFSISDNKRDLSQDHMKKCYKEHYQNALVGMKPPYGVTWDYHTLGE